MFDFRPIEFTPAAIEETCALLAVVFPEAHHITPEYLGRLYSGNPLGDTWGLSCFDDAGRLVAHNIMIPIEARVFGQVEIGIWPFQLATHPEARMKGLFVEMNKATENEAADRGFKFLSGVGNQNSSPIFVKKWNYQAVCQLDAKIGLGTIPLSGELEGSDLTRIWDDPVGIKWRLGHAPHSPYQVEYRDDIGHIFADSGRYGIKVEIGAFHRSLLPDDLAPLRTLNPLRLWLGIDPTRNWKGSLYFDIPERLKPSPLILLWHDLTDQGRRLNPEKVQFEIFDFDAF
jgi:hypothetical protein